MLHIKYALLVTIVLLALNGCGQNQKSASSENGNQKNTSSKEYNIDHQMIDTDLLELSKNDGEKWKVDTVTRKQMHQIKAQVEKYGRKMPKVSLNGYHKLSANIDNAISRMENEADLNKKTEAQFTKINQALKKEVEVLKKDNKKASQVALVNLSELTKAYYQHFEYKNGQK